MRDQQHMISHLLNLDDEFLHTTDDIQISLSPRRWISVVELLTFATLILLFVLGSNLLVCHSFQFTCAQLVEQSHLFDIELVLVEELDGLNTPLEHACPYTEVALLVS